MDSHANAATPSKAGREGMTGAADLSTPGPAFGTPAMMDISSPDPAAFSFARQKHPPAISSKPRSSRKVSSLFSGESGETAGPSDAAAAAATADAAAKKWVSDNNGIVPAGGSLCSEGDQAASPQSSSGGGGGGGAGFTSPVRASQESGATSSRFTPQRNLGGLFASPLAPPPPLATHEDGGAHHSLTAAVPLLLQSPKRKEAPAPAPAGKREDEAASTRPETRTAADESPASVAAASPAAEVTPAPVATLSPVAAPKPPAATPAAAATATAAAATATSVSPTRPPPACQCGCSSSGVTDADCGDVVRCVSNESFKDGEPMRTLEVLVKRERVGVSALASWRVAELKRRLVHLDFFPAAEMIALVPTFPLGAAALEDDVVLDTLDADVTYKARRVAVAAT